MGELAGAEEVVNRIRARARQDVMGRDEVIELALIALLSNGHLLLEDYPGSGKTTLAKTIGESISASEADSAHETLTRETLARVPFRRVQFTPDMLPSDITGTMVFDAQQSEFSFRPGPIFSYVLLVDEINRTSPKVQSAMLEAMAERQVTIDQRTYPLDELFFVIATQNPLDSVGTYPLPVAQLDRFLFKVQMKHIEREAEIEVLNAWGEPRQKTPLPTVSRDEVIEARAAIRNSIYVHDEIKECLLNFSERLRADRRCQQSTSTRALVQALPALQSSALLSGRDFVSPDDLERLVVPIFAHRLSLIPGVRNASAVIWDALREPLDQLSRFSIS
jgi:MoxR-like ATPase